MGHSIRRWLDWAMTDLLQLASRRPSDQAVHVRYEKAGLTLYGPPVPWNADAVVVELLARLPPAARGRTDFLLRVPGSEPVVAEAVRRDEAVGKYRVHFRLPVPPGPAVAEVLWRHRLLATVPLDVQTADQFTAGLRLTSPTIAVRLAGLSVAAETFVASQCRGVTAAAVLRSPAALAPLADLGVRVVFRSDRGSAEHAVAVPLTSSQLASKEALVTASPARFPRRAGTYSVTWLVGDRELLAQRVTAITARRFLQSLRVADTRFAVANKVGPVRPVRTAPPLADVARVGPCFVLASREPGAAGLLSLQVAATVPGAVRPPTIFEQTVLVTDGPSVFAPGLVDVSDLAGGTGFELRHRGRVLGVMSLSPVPSAAFNAEGGFKPPPDFAWTNAAEDELNDRLGRLLGGTEGAPLPRPPDDRSWG